VNYIMISDFASQTRYAKLRTRSVATSFLLLTMSTHNRSPNALERDTKRQKFSHPSDMDEDIANHPRTPDVDMQDASPVSDSPSPSGLPRVPDDIDPHLHAKYDLEVNEEMGTGSTGRGHFATLLQNIVAYCDGKLDVKYKDILVAKGIVRENGQLEAELRKAWDLRTYREIRLLGASGSNPVTLLH
jgi:hypothetical protein